VQKESKGIVLLLIDSIGAFYHTDRARSDTPASNTVPGGGAYAQDGLRTTNTCAFQGPFPLERLKLQTVHKDLVAALQHLRAAFPLAVMLTKKVAVDDEGLPRDFLPSVWKVRLVVFFSRLVAR
jgi:hypothetical protein